MREVRHLAGGRAEQSVERIVTVAPEHDEIDVEPVGGREDRSPGLTSSTLLSLFLVPVMFMSFAKRPRPEQSEEAAPIEAPHDAPPAHGVPA